MYHKLKCVYRYKSGSRLLELTRT